MRLTKEELQKKLEENNCKYTMSWSRLNQYREDKYSFFLKVLKRIPEEKSNNYAILGSCVHDALEQFYNNAMTREDMIEKFQDAVYEQSLSETNFVSDAKKNANIENNYKETILHFLHNYNKIDNSKLEIFAGMPFGHGYYFQGYVDHLYPEKDLETGKTYLVIEDFKTSTLYTGKKIEENSGQLKLYAYMISKMNNIPLSQIKIRWNFLKYVNADIEQKSGSIKTSKILRNELAEKLQVKFKMWCKALGYSDEETLEFYEKLQKNADEYKDYTLFDGIPDDIASKFYLYDCYVDVPCDEETIKHFIKSVEETIDDMSTRIEKYKLTQDENLFWVDVTKENAFYFTNLCGYTAKYHKPLRKYYESLPDYKAFTFEVDNKADKKNEKIDDDILSFLFGSDDDEGDE